MKRFVSALVVCVIAITMPVAYVAAANGSSDLQTLVKGNTQFALDLYKQINSAEGNLFFSPYSISVALGMTYGGARGDTAQQMAQVLHFSLDQSKLHPAFAALEAKIKNVQQTKDIQLSIANSLWPQKKYPFLPEYFDLVKKYYGVSIIPVDYQTKTEAARKQINTWVEDKTEDKIKDLIQPGVLDFLTRLVLVNAIYFKGNWQRQFDRSGTQSLPFYVDRGKTIDVPMMTQMSRFKYAETDQLKILALPYNNPDLSMIVLLPQDRDGLPKLEESLTEENVKHWVSLLREQKVEVYLPKFKMTSQFELAETLEQMGMKDAFSSKADFSGMDGRLWLYIGAVLHKAFVEVNEEGTEAAAATAVVMKELGMPEEIPTFYANHPFLFLIRENTTGNILFIGRMVDPSK